MQQQQNRRPFNKGKNQHQQQETPKKPQRPATLTDTMKFVDGALFFVSVPMILVALLTTIFDAAGVTVTPGSAGRTFLIFLGLALLVFFLRTEKDLRAEGKEYGSMNMVSWLFLGFVLGCIMGGFFFGAIFGIVFAVVSSIFGLNTNYITIGLVFAWLINLFRTWLSGLGFWDQLTYLFSSNIWEYNIWANLLAFIVTIVLGVVTIKKEEKDKKESKTDAQTQPKQEEETKDSSEEEEEIEVTDSSNEDDEEEEKAATPVAKQFFQNPQPDEDAKKNFKKNMKFW